MASAPPAAASDARTFEIGPRVARAVRGVAYERRPGDPACRPLRVFATDPTTSLVDGAVAIIEVPYEPVEPGPIGMLFAVDSCDQRCGGRYAPLDLDDPGVMLRDGHAPSPTDPRFHLQMVYAVSSAVYATFRRALGRHVAWGFDGDGATTSAPGRLTLRPFATGERNAYYDRSDGTVCFGYCQAPADAHGLNPPGSFVFTSLSHDVVAHELTHALLDGLRAHFAHPTGPDVPAFHEGFADLVALFHRFSYPDVLRAALRRARGDLTRDQLLTDIARQLGDTTGAGRALRSAVDQVGVREPLVYDPALPAHAPGGVLVAAVFEAFAVVFRRKVARYVRLAGGATSPNAELSTDLLELLVERCGRLARQFLNMCVRAIDYCPPVDLEFGDFLRAVITADQELVPDDPWRYREALIHAFGRRRIYPRHVTCLTEDALRWSSPQRPLPPISALGFGHLQFRGDPARPAGEEELRRQARVLGAVVTDPAWRGEFGVLPAAVPDVDPPCIESIRSSRRIGPDGQVVFDLVAEVTQRRTARLPDGRPFDFYRGATLVLGPEGEVRYVVRKRVNNPDRERAQAAFVRDTERTLWIEERGRLQPQRQLFRLMHAES